MAEGQAQAHVVSAYEKWAPIYDWIWRGYLNKTFAVALDMLALTGTERILDVACGTGELERRILARWPAQPIVGVDLTEAMLARARAKCAGFSTVRFLRADGARIPQPDGTFDIALSCSAMHYWPEPVRVLREMARCLRPGGRVLILDWCRDFRRGKLYDCVRRGIFRSHHQVHTRAELREFLAAAGLKPRAERTFSVLAVWSMMCVEAGRNAE